MLYDRWLNPMLNGTMDLDSQFCVNLLYYRMRAKRMGSKILRNDLLLWMTDACTVIIY